MGTALSKASEGNQLVQLSFPLLVQVDAFCSAFAGMKHPLHPYSSPPLSSSLVHNGLLKC